MSLLLAAGCSSSSGHRAVAPSTTTPAGTVTVDRWNPPALSGPASAANFCAAVTAIYRHMAELPHVTSPKVAADILSDYVAYAPTVVGEAPPAVQPSASLYIRTVAAYLQRLDRAGLNEGRLPPGSLESLAAPNVNVAFTRLSGYSQTECHYAIGPNGDGQIG